MARASGLQNRMTQVGPGGRLQSKRKVLPAVLTAVVLLLTGLQAGSSSVQVPEQAIGGTVTQDGVGVAGASVDLFTEGAAEGVREEFLTSTSTLADGTYNFFVADVGCYVLTFIAPEGQTYNGGRFLQARTCVEEAGTATVDASLDSAIPAETSVSGTVTDQGAPADGVKVDLFQTAADGSRGSYLESTTTGADGTYRFDTDAGCYTLTFIAPVDRVFANGSAFFTDSVCAEPDAPAAGVDAELQVVIPTDASIGGTVLFRNGEPAAGVQVDLFIEAESGGRGAFVDFTTTADDGGYGFDVVAGCYIATFIAPDGETFVGGGLFFQSQGCVESGETNSGLNAVLDAEVISPASLGGTLTDGSGGPVEGAEVTFWDTAGDGSRSNYLGSEFTDGAGGFSFGVEAGCYWLVFVAPDGETFNDTPFFERFVCVEDGDVLTDLDAALDSGPPPTTTTTTMPTTTTTEPTTTTTEPTTTTTLPTTTTTEPTTTTTLPTTTTTEPTTTTTLPTTTTTEPTTTTTEPTTTTTEPTTTTTEPTTTTTEPTTTTTLPTTTTTEPTTTTTLPTTTTTLPTTTTTEPTTTTTLPTTTTTEPTTTTTLPTTTTTEPTTTTTEPTTTTTLPTTTTTLPTTTTTAPTTTTTLPTTTTTQPTTTTTEPTTTTTAPTTTTTAPPAEITISVDDVSVVELDVDGLRNAQVRFSLNAPAEQTVVVQYTTVDGTATVADGDYIARSGELRFAPGRTELFRAVRILGDIEVEGDETLTVELSDPVNATIADGVGEITIIDNDVVQVGVALFF